MLRAGRCRGLRLRCERLRWHADQSAGDEQHRTEYTDDAAAQHMGGVLAHASACLFIFLA